MNAIIENIIRTAPISFDDNYKTRLKQRSEILNKRLDKLMMWGNRGFVDFQNGVAVRFFPNTTRRKDFNRIDRLTRLINKELNEIGKYV